jgi:predicted acylesterase/phospholipase RssA
VRPEPLDDGVAPPPQRYCDVVLTGGVTDGVVYPWAIVELARHYRFKNIGGTSVGAMAAALTAAAEYTRRRGYLFGFNKVMMEVPERLAECVPGVGTRIFSLFQPSKGTEKLFRLFVEFFSSGALSLQEAATAHIGGVPDAPARSVPGRHRSWGQRLLARFETWARAAIRLLTPLTIVASVYRGAALGGAAAGLVLFLIVLGFALDGVMAAPLWYAVLLVSLMPILIGLPLIAFFVLLCAGLAIRRDVLRGLVKNHYGMCTGMRPAHIPEDRPSLVEWLHKGIQAAAGKPLHKPLTFADLWDAPQGPPVVDLPPTRRRKSRSIDLRMITTNITHGRPYEFPLEEDAPPIFFKRSELRRFFPATVIGHLVRHSLTYAEARAQYRDLPDPRDQRNVSHLRLLPKDQLPVLVAARLSLSFPFLFSAVPLWELDREPEDKAAWRMRRCRFSDGGICSNFPIHMFDSAVPEWPTFGIALETRGVFRPNTNVWMPSSHERGGEDSWFRFDERNPATGARPTLGDRLIGFLGGIFYSAKDWNDKSAMRLPGVRDRIVHVALKTPGGLNLKIEGDEIMALARDYGAPAGRELVRRFIENNRPAPAWEEHRWVRFQSFLTGLRERIEMIRDATQNRRYGDPMSNHIRNATADPPLVPGPNLTPRQARDLEQLLQSLQELEKRFAAASLPQPYKPVPKPGLHIRAPL